MNTYRIKKVQYTTNHTGDNIELIAATLDPFTQYGCVLTHNDLVGKSIQSMAMLYAFITDMFILAWGNGENIIISGDIITLVAFDEATKYRAAQKYTFVLTRNTEKSNEVIYLRNQIEVLQVNEEITKTMIKKIIKHDGFLLLERTNDIVKRETYGYQIVVKHINGEYNIYFIGSDTSYLHLTQSEVALTLAHIFSGYTDIITKNVMIYDAPINAITDLISFGELVGTHCVIITLVNTPISDFSIIAKMSEIQYKNAHIEFVGTSARNLRDDSFATSPRVKIYVDMSSVCPRKATADSNIVTKHKRIPKFAAGSIIELQDTILFTNHD